MRNVLELMERHRGHPTCVLRTHRELPDEARREIDRKRDAYRTAVEETVARGIAAGELRGVDARLVTSHCWDVQLAYRQFRPDGPLSANRIAELFRRHPP